MYLPTKIATHDSEIQVLNKTKLKNTSTKRKNFQV